MAYYTPSNLATAQALLIQAFETSEMKFRDPRVYKLFLQNSSIMLPNYDQLRTREDRTLTAYYKKRSSRSLGTGRTHNHTGNRGDSGSLTPSWTTYKDVFSHSLKQGNNNMFTLDQMMLHDLQNSLINHIEGHEAVAAAYLFAQRSEVNTAVVDGNFNTVTDTFEIPVDGTTTFGAYNNRAAQITKIVMEINKWAGNYTVVCDSVSFAKFQAQAAQGATNATNLSFNFSGVEFIHSVDLYAMAAGLSYTDGYWIAVPSGTIACLPHIPKENRLGIETKIQSYGSIINPIDGQSYAIHEYPTAGDYSGTGGYTQDEVTQVETSIDLAFEHAPVPAGLESPIQAFAIHGS